MIEKENFSKKLFNWLGKLFLYSLVVAVFLFLLYLLIQSFDIEESRRVVRARYSVRGFLCVVFVSILSLYIYAVGFSALEVFIYKDYNKNKENIVINGEIDKRHYYEQFIQKLTILLIEVLALFFIILFSVEIKHIKFLMGVLKDYYFNQKYLFVFFMALISIIVGYVVVRIYKLFIYEEKYVSPAFFNSLAKLEEKRKKKMNNNNNNNE